MLTGQSLDVLLGLAGVYLVVAIICSSINELIAAALELRAKTLAAGVQQLLGPLAESVLDHPLISNTTAPNKSPSYIEPAIFAAALLDEVTKAMPAEKAADPDSIRSAVTAQVEGPAKASFLAFLDVAKGNYDTFLGYIATWFGAHMDRVSGGYKRRAHTIITICAVLVVGILNVDSLQIYNRLVAQPAAATALAERAKAIAQTSAVQASVNRTTNTGLSGQLGTLNRDLESLELPIGWHRAAGDFANPFLKLIGLLITAIAASLGAPFWFDVLGKLANMRATGDKPAPAKSAAS